MFTFESYLSSLKEKLSSHFNLTSSVSVGEGEYELFGEMNIRNSKYVLSKKAQIYGYENNEFLWLRIGQDDSVAALKEELGVLKGQISGLVKNHKEHMSSLLSLTIVLEGGIARDLERFARRFHYQKGFALGFKGWADLVLVIVSLEENRVITHRNFMKTAVFFQPEKVCQKERT
jgi:hypothetical protein